MTPVDAALMIWAAGTLLFTVIEIRGARDLADSDPLTLCDPCRDSRRMWLSMADFGALPYLLAHTVIAVMWPLTAPWEYGRFAWDLIRFKIVPGAPSPWCDCSARHSSLTDNQEGRP